jgi:putative endonuclease
MSERHFYVYMVTNTFHNVIYTGMTNDLSRRIFEHIEKRGAKFPSRYKLTKLVYYELHYTAESAIVREKKLKDWHRPWKDRLVTEFNPKWDDLFSLIAHG